MTKTIIDHIQERTVVEFAKHTGCPKCSFLERSVENSEHKDSIVKIYLDDYDREDALALDIMGTPVMAVVEGGKIIERDTNVITVEQLNDFMARV